jgi:hypothetical protein
MLLGQRAKAADFPAETPVDRQYVGVCVVRAEACDCVEWGVERETNKKTLRPASDRRAEMCSLMRSPYGRTSRIIIMLTIGADSDRTQGLRTVILAR